MADTIASLATRPSDLRAANYRASRRLVTPQRLRGFVITEPDGSAGTESGTEPDGSSGTEQAK